MNEGTHSGKSTICLKASVLQDPQTAFTFTFVSLDTNLASLDMDLASLGTNPTQCNRNYNTCITDVRTDEVSVCLGTHSSGSRNDVTYS